MKATIIIDSSGSMITFEKRNIIMQLLNQFYFKILTNTTKYKGYDLVIWGENLVFVENAINFSIDQIPCEGKNCAELFNEATLKLKNQELSKHIFVFSDGFFDKKISKLFRDWQAKNKNEFIIKFIAIGADSSLYHIQKLLLEDTPIFLAENFLSSLEAEYQNQPIVVPETIEDLSKLNLLLDQI